MKKINSLLLLPCFLFGACNNDSTMIESVPKTPGLVVDGGNELTFTPEELRLPGKKGACFTLKVGDANYEQNINRVKQLNPYWNYSWNYNYAPDQPDYIEFIPMTWSKFTPELFYEAVMPLVESGHIKRALGFNEPDQTGQANMTVEEALELWPALQNLKIPLGSPAPANGRGEWLEQFMQGIEERGYRVDYICIHVYAGPNVSGLKNYVNDVYNKYKKPILITEFAAADWNASTPSDNKWTEEQVLNYMKDALDYLESDDRVLGYAWFPFSQTSGPGCRSALYNQDGTLTKLGEYYAAYPNEPGGGDGDGGDEEYDGGLVPLGDFETSYDDIKKYWKFTEANITNKYPISGTQSAYLALRSNKYCALDLIEGINVEPGKTYEFGCTARVMTSQVGSGEGENPKGKALTMKLSYGSESKSITCKSTSDEKIHGEITIPDGITNVKISFWTSWASIYAYIDNVYFRLKE